MPPYKIVNKPACKPIIGDTLEIQLGILNPKTIYVEVVYVEGSAKKGKIKVWSRIVGGSSTLLLIWKSGTGWFCWLDKKYDHLHIKKM